MRIGLNAQLLSLSQDYRGTGVNWYIYHLLKYLPSAAGTGHQFIAYTGEANAPRLLPGISFRLNRFPTRNPLTRIIWEQSFLPLHLKSDGIEVQHGLGFVLPLMSSIPGAITIFDLGFVLFPQAHKPWRRLYLSTMAKISAQRAKKIIAISQSTKDDLSKLWGIPPEKVAVVYLGADDEFYADRREEEIERLRRERNLPQRMILNIGTIEPRKNLPTLLAAYAQLKRNGLPHILVIAGAPGWGAEEVYHQVEQLGLQGKVLFPGYIPSAELPLWYRAADLFVYPSLYEGFGLPPLEAMASGSPVIVSRSSSLPEVVGEAGISVDSQNSGELAMAMARVLKDRDLREEMQAKGKEQARKFSWERTARETLAVYESISRN
ncbi:MAG: glycosyltransferase family 4 protein [Chloroflexi bacterium]|nr:glycosyltransferase family 4 protein [Chloroflexota bacterium]